MTEEEREFGARMFGVLGSPARIQILEFLAQGPASVKEISLAVGLKQSMASQHLGALLHAGVVVKQARGNVRIYSLRGPGVAAILNLVEECYLVHIDSLRVFLNRRYGESSHVGRSGQAHLKNVGN